MQERTTSAKIQVSQLEERVCGLSSDLLDNVKSTHMLRSQLGYTQHMKYDQCKELSNEITENLDSLRRMLIEESAEQSQFFDTTEKDLKKLRGEKRDILNNSRILESRIAMNETELGVMAEQQIEDLT